MKATVFLIIMKEWDSDSNCHIYHNLDIAYLWEQDAIAHINQLNDEYEYRTYYYRAITLHINKERIEQ